MQTKLSRIVVDYGADVLTPRLVKGLNRLECLDGQADALLNPSRIAIVRLGCGFDGGLRDGDLPLSRTNLCMCNVYLAGNLIHQTNFLLQALLIDRPSLVACLPLGEAEVSQLPICGGVEIEAVSGIKNVSTKTTTK